MLAIFLQTAFATLPQGSASRLSLSFHRLADMPFFAVSLAYDTFATEGDSDELLAESFDTQTDTVLTYIAGYIAKKVEPEVCGSCRTKIKGE